MMSLVARGQLGVAVSAQLDRPSDAKSVVSGVDSTGRVPRGSGYIRERGLVYGLRGDLRGR